MHQQQERRNGGMACARGSAAAEPYLLEIVQCLTTMQPVYKQKRWAIHCQNGIKKWLAIPTFLQWGFAELPWYIKIIMKPRSLTLPGK